MREHLFRGKRKDNGEWVIGSLIHCGDGSALIAKSQSTAFVQSKTAVALNGCYDVIPETVGEFTGLTDKNGVKIFEGDILKIAEVIFLVQWNKRTGSFCGVSEIDDVQTKHLGYVNLCEVIGNIHDNPELLKEASE